jgi:hypothetical protein
MKIGLTTPGAPGETVSADAANAADARTMIANTITRPTSGDTRFLLDITFSLAAYAGRIILDARILSPLT